MTREEAFTVLEESIKKDLPDDQKQIAVALITVARGFLDDVRKLANSPVLGHPPAA